MAWNRTAIGAMSSVIGGICVVISVVFLVDELRHNAKAIDGATVRSPMSLERDVFAILSEHAELCLQGCADREGLSDTDRFREAHLGAVDRTLGLGGFVASRDGFKAGYPARFRALITGAVARAA